MLTCDVLCVLQHSYSFHKWQCAGHLPEQTLGKPFQRQMWNVNQKTSGAGGGSHVTPQTIIQTTLILLVMIIFQILR